MTEDTEQKIPWEVKSQLEKQSIKFPSMMEAGKEQQQDKIGLCRYIIVNNPINHVAEKSIGTMYLMRTINTSSYNCKAKSDLLMKNIFFLHLRPLFFLLPIDIFVLIIGFMKLILI